MAKATKRTVPPVVPPVEYILTMCQEEAQTLVDVFAKVGGISETSRRKYIDTVLSVLGSVGVRYGVTSDLVVVNGSFWFNTKEN